MKSREELFYAKEKGLKPREEFEREYKQRVASSLVQGLPSRSGRAS